METEPLRKRQSQIMATYASTSLFLPSFGLPVLLVLDCMSLSLPFLCTLFWYGPRGGRLFSCSSSRFHEGHAFVRGEEGREERKEEDTSYHSPLAAPLSHFSSATSKVFVLFLQSFRELIGVFCPHALQSYSNNTAKGSHFSTNN